MRGKRKRADHDGMEHLPICIDCKRAINDHDAMCEVQAAEREQIAIKILRRMAQN